MAFLSLLRKRSFIGQDKPKSLINDFKRDDLVVKEPTHVQLIANLRRANQVAIQARASGHHPFGAILVAPDHETLLLAQANLDVVNHAEAVLARAAFAQFSPEYLWDCTLYTTVEPCVMCAGTQYWANIGRLVYGISEEQLLKLTGGDRQNPTMSLPCREVFARGQKSIQVWGAIAEVRDEIMTIHQDFWQSTTPKH